MSASASLLASRVSVTPPEPISARAVAEAPTAVSPGDALPASAPGPNPSLRVDPQLGIVVLQFQDSHGKTLTLPTQRALAAYRLSGVPHAHAHAATPPPTQSGAEPAGEPERASQDPGRRPAPELSTKA